MLRGKGRYWRSGNKVYIYIPIEVVLDSAFPLKERKGDVDVEIIRDHLEVSERG